MSKQEDAKALRQRCLNMTYLPDGVVVWIRRWVEDGTKPNAKSCQRRYEQLEVMFNNLQDVAKGGAQHALDQLKSTLQHNHPYNFAVFSAIDTLQTLLLRDGFEYPDFVPYQQKVQQLEEALAERSPLDALERAVVDAYLEERRARDALPKLDGVPMDYQAQVFDEFWEANRRLEAAYAKTEKAMDALVAARSSQVIESGKAVGDKKDGDPAC